MIKYGMDRAVYIFLLGFFVFVTKPVYGVDVKSMEKKTYKSLVRIQNKFDKSSTVKEWIESIKNTDEKAAFRAYLGKYYQVPLVSTGIYKNTIYFFGKPGSGPDYLRLSFKTPNSLQLIYNGRNISRRKGESLRKWFQRNFPDVFATKTGFFEIPWSWGLLMNTAEANTPETVGLSAILAAATALDFFKRDENDASLLPIKSPDTNKSIGRVVELLNGNKHFTGWNKAGSTPRCISPSGSEKEVAEMSVPWEGDTLKIIIRKPDSEYSNYFDFEISKVSKAEGTTKREKMTENFRLQKQTENYEMLRLSEEGFDPVSGLPQVMSQLMPGLLGSHIIDYTLDGKIVSEEMKDEIISMEICRLKAAANEGMVPPSQKSFSFDNLNGEDKKAKLIEMKSHMEKLLGPVPDSTKHYFIKPFSAQSNEGEPCSTFEDFEFTVLTSSQGELVLDDTVYTPVDLGQYFELQKSVCGKDIQLQTKDFCVFPGGNICEKKLNLSRLQAYRFMVESYRKDSGHTVRRDNKPGSQVISSRFMSQRFASFNHLKLKNRSEELTTLYTGLGTSTHEKLIQQLVERQQSTHEKFCIDKLGEENLLKKTLEQLNSNIEKQKEHNSKMPDKKAAATALFEVILSTARVCLNPSQSQKKYFNNNMVFPPPSISPKIESDGNLQ